MTIRSYWSAISVVLHHQEPVLARLSSVPERLHRPSGRNREATALIERTGSRIPIFDEQRQALPFRFLALLACKGHQLSADPLAAPRCVHGEHGDEPLAAGLPLKVDDRPEERLGFRYLWHRRH